MKPNIWDQLKSLTSSELVSALQNKTYHPKQLKELFKDIGWTEQDLKRLKLIK